MAARLRVTQVKSTIGHIARNRGTVRALGLRRIGHTVEVPDNPATRGMVRQVRFLVSVESIGSRERSGRSRAAGETESSASAAATADDAAPSSTDAPGSEATPPASERAVRPRRKPPARATEEES
jgi:large subunit ribosomal protein L30